MSQSTYKRTHDAVANIGEYTDRETGEKKHRTVQVGSLFVNDEGHMNLKMDAVPVGQEWSGWVKLFPVRDRK
jgi:hypothetical protein